MTITIYVFPAAGTDGSKAQLSTVLLPLQPLLCGHGLHHNHHPQHAIWLTDRYLNHLCPGLLTPDVLLHSVICYRPCHSHSHGIRSLRGDLQPSAIQQHHDQACPTATCCRSLGIRCNLHSSCYCDCL